MDAIVYVSKTGFTQRYAEMLSRELTLPVMSLDEARMKLGKGAQIIFWAGFRRIEFGAPGGAQTLRSARP